MLLTPRPDSFGQKLARGFSRVFRRYCTLMESASEKSTIASRAVIKRQDPKHRWLIRSVAITVWILSCVLLVEAGFRANILPGANADRDLGIPFLLLVIGIFFW